MSLEQEKRVNALKANIRSYYADMRDYKNKIKIASQLAKESESLKDKVDWMNERDEYKIRVIQCQMLIRNEKLELKELELLK